MSTRKLRGIATVCAAMLFAGAITLTTISTKAADPKEKAAAAKKSADAAKKAETDAAAAEAAADEAQQKADAADAKAGKKKTKAEQKAEDAAKKAEEEADAAEADAAEADDAADASAAEAQEKQQDADDAADAAKKEGHDKDKDKEAADKQKEADAAKTEAKLDETKAAEKEADADKADKKADAADDKLPHRDVAAARKKARRLRNLARRLRRQANRDIRDAEQALHDRDKVDGNSKSGDDSARKDIDDAKKKLNGEDSAGDTNQRNIMPSGYASPNVTTKTGNGVHVVSFETSAGRISVNVPDDMIAGDTISGTVTTEPKGDTPEESKKNQDILNGYVIDLEGTKVPTDQARFGWTPITSRASTPVRYQIRLIEVLPPSQTETGAVVTPEPRVVGQTYLTPFPNSPVVLSGAETTPVNPEPKAVQPFKIPSLGQRGRTLVITGPFDGDSTNTKINFQQVETGGTPGWIALNPLVESQNQVVVATPTNVIGPIQIRVNEGNRETTSAFRNVGVKLSAPTTNLRRDQSVIVTIRVEGLQGIAQELGPRRNFALSGVPLHLTKSGVVTMQGGDSQTTQIKPSEVQADGSFTTTRTVTGQQAGTFSVTATVVVFNTCLQDDNNGNSLILSSSTQDFIFCEGRSSAAVQNPIVISPLNLDFTGGVFVQAADGLSDMRTEGSQVYVNFNHRAARINGQLDRASHSGAATIQTATQKFTITDRDTRNNTCGCN